VRSLSSRRSLRHRYSRRSTGGYPQPLPKREPRQIGPQQWGPFFSLGASATRNIHSGHITLDIYTRTWDTTYMSWSRKIAFLMLAVAVLWTAMPASACVLAMQSSARSACCSDMPQSGTMHAISMHPSCCQIRGSVPAVVPAPPFSLDHSQQPTLVPYTSSLASFVTRSSAWRDTLEARPPKFPPGGIFILRI